jgi:hypothetical protein
VSVEPYLPEHDHIDPHLAKDPDHIATLMDSEPAGDGTGRNFPDLWARLHAQEGYESAARIWKTACANPRKRSKGRRETLTPKLQQNTEAKPVFPDRRVREDGHFVFFCPASTSWR